MAGKHRGTISIHAPREGSDGAVCVPAQAAVCISIHAPREGSDMNATLLFIKWEKFLSTLPARGATLYGHDFRHHVWISIHAPREGSDPKAAKPSGCCWISIHAPREGSDEWIPFNYAKSCKFLSTLPARGATRIFSTEPLFVDISIHAPREGSDRGPG